MRRSPLIKRSTRASPQANSPAHLLFRIPKPACNLWRSLPYPNGKLHAPYFMQWSFAVERQIGTMINLRAQYVGTRAVNQPYTTQVNALSDSVSGLLCPVPLWRTCRSQVRAVTQLSTAPIATTTACKRRPRKRLGHGLQVQANYTWSHCIDTVSNGGFLQFSAGGILSPIPGELSGNRGPCDYDVRDNLTAGFLYELPIKLRGRLGPALNGWQISGSGSGQAACRSLFLSAPYSANGDGIVNGSGPQFASVVAGVPLYDPQCDSSVTQPGTIQWLNPNAFVSSVDPSTGACVGGQYAAELSVWRSGTQHPAGSRFHLE